MLFHSLAIIAFLASGLLFGQLSAAKHGHSNRIAEQMRERPKLEHRANASSQYRFLNSDTEQYRVHSLPEVDFDIGEMYSGLIPIDPKNTSRALFFVFQPTIGPPVDEITIWMNGGPGCASMMGFFQENGRFTWIPGTFKPVENPYTWVNLTNMLWVDQPIGTGYSIGTPTATSQEETAQDFIQFFKNFQTIFDIKKFKTYVTGESYAGRCVPYISAAMLDAKDPDYYDLRGALLYDPTIGQYDYAQEEAQVVPFVQKNANLFNFNQSFMEYLESRHKSCGYEEFIDKYLVFPAVDVQPPKSINYTSQTSCALFDMALVAVWDLNPCFNIYEITTMCPMPWNAMGYLSDIEYIPPGFTPYFDRSDVKAALHAPNVNWTQCSSNVYVGGSAGPEGEGDISANPIEHVLPQVIEATNRVLISNGDYDMVIITNGTLLSIQNMTWNGKLGFESMPNKPINISIPDLVYANAFQAQSLTGFDGPQGIMGIQHYERGLMWAETFQSGHMQPQFQPRVAYRHLEWLLGRTEEI
ncbi:Alpha/Beta hydrolase fold [Elaphomyces granulatus]